MKKMLLSLVVALGLAAHGAAAVNDGTPLLTGGGDMLSGSMVTLGNYAGAPSTIAVYGLALCDITKGDIVVGPLGTSYTARMGVSKTATAGDVTAIGIALATASYGAQVRIGILGPVIATSGITSWTVGQTFGTAGTAGYITATSGLTAGTYTSLSMTPIKGRVMSTKVTAAGGSILVCLGCK